jgi:hypothetical protein
MATVKVTLKEVGETPITREIPIGPNGAKSADLSHVMDYISKYHGSKSYSGMQLMVNGVEGGTGTIVPDGAEIRVARPVRAGKRKSKGRKSR